MHRNRDAIVVGGGLVGLAVGYGLSCLGMDCLVLDGADTDYRAARGNFGLVWVQGKGAGFPAYADWTMRSAECWPQLQAMLAEDGAINQPLEQQGGLHICLDEEEFESRRERLELLRGHQNGRFRFEMLDRQALAEVMPGIGKDIAGASWCPHDGHTSPLQLMRGLHQGITRQGGAVMAQAAVEHITPQQGDFMLTTRAGRFSCGLLVLAAGLGNRDLAPMVGLNQPVRPVKGQILVTEKTAASITLPMTHMRQTAEGSIMIGDSHEEAGFDITSTTAEIGRIAARARRVMPAFANLQIIRSWAALRVMSPDGYPIYDQSADYPGAFAVTCHSGVTLAAAHALDLAADLAAGQLGTQLAAFSERRF